ncbi:hypothetical protein UB46_04590 [Burkholderiaceae bacterium 16]|nr:hypothetical protein UB46_04590 [Burkholderiaceae bacterium 16]
MISSQFISRVSLRRDIVDSFERHPFCLPAVRTLDAMEMHRFGGNGLYLLDEPEAALSPQRQLAVLSRIHDLVEDGSQFIIATHSPILMAYRNAWINTCSPDGVARIDYQDTEHFRVTRDFLASPERMLRVLLDGEPGEAKEPT